MPRSSHSSSSWSRRSFGCFGVEEHEVDNDQIVAGAVGDQNVAVPVKNVAARGFDRRHILHGVRVGRHEAVFRLHRLKLIQPQHIAAHQERDQT